MKRHAWMISVLACAPAWAQPVQSSVPTPPRIQPDPKPQRTTGPIFTCDNSPFDFGEVWAGARIEHQFKVANKGNETLQILEVKPACSCTVVGDYKRVLAPGETAVFPAVMDTAHKRGRTDIALEIVTNEPGADSRRKLQLVGTVKTVAQLEPLGTNFFNSVSNDKPETRRLVLKNTSGRPLKLELLPLASTSPFKVALEESKPGQEFVVVVTAAGPFKEGNTKEAVKFKTDVPESPTFTLELNAFRHPRIHLNPPYMAVDGNQRQPQSRKLWITNNGDKPFEITRIEATHPRLLPKLVKRDGNRWEYEVMMPAFYRPRTSGEAMTLHTTDAEQPTIVVRVVPYGRPPPADLVPSEARALAAGDLGAATPATQPAS